MSGPSERVAIIGAGVMGSGIAQVLAVAGHPVVVHDVADRALSAARDGVENGRFGLRNAVQRAKLTEQEADEALQRLTFSADPDSVTDVDVVVEAVPEQLDLKIRLFRDLDSRCARTTILATNSSGYPVQALAAATDRPDRVVCWHWASPAPVMRLAEIVRGPETSDETVQLVVRLAQRCGKNPVVVQDSARHWGYVANRVYGAMIREANAVVTEGIATRDQVDQLMMDCFRWPSGPFGMVAGATTGWKAPSEAGAGGGS